MNRETVNYGSLEVRLTKYEKFRGVDFSTDPSLIDRSRSPFAPNMISDPGGNPEKRPGWRTVWQIDAPVNGLYYGVLGEETVFLAHGGTNLYRWWPERQPEILREGVADRRSVMFAMAGKLWILTGREYLCYDGEQVQDVSQIAYLPTTIIARAPAGGGTVYESVNLLQPGRTNRFLSDGSSTVYQLDSTGLDDTAVQVEVDGKEMTEGNGFTVDREKGQVIFSTAPGAPSVKGQDNVFITFYKTVEGYRDRIEKSTICTLYGVGTSDRVFFAGNPDERNVDRWSGLGDPSYVPDLNYATVGVEATAIMGYRRLGEYLAIIKEDNGQDSTIFLRSASYTSSGVSFPVKQGVAGVGAVSPWAFANLLDEPLFLSGTGVYAITSNIITAERTVQNRSWFVDTRLTRERDLSKAVAVEWKGYYLLCVDTRCYILDGRQNKSYKPQSNGEYVYECYYWENFPAAVLMNWKQGDQESLWFGTRDGRICRMNDDMETMDRFSDDGAAIVAAWATKYDDDGAATRLKTMRKKGSAVTLKPYRRSSAKVLVRTDKEMETQLRYETMDIFDWEDLDFSRFTFASDDSPQEILFRTKKKKYKRMQIIIKNDGVNEGFGVYGILKYFTVGGYAKR